jgi:hypothetical protein
MNLVSDINLFSEWVNSVMQGAGNLGSALCGVKVFPTEAIPDGEIVLATSREDYIAAGNFGTILEIAALVPSIEIPSHIRAAMQYEIQRRIEEEEKKAFIGIDYGEPGTRNLTAAELMRKANEIKRPTDWQERAEKAEKRVKELEKEVNRLKLQVMKAGRR